MRSPAFDAELSQRAKMDTADMIEHMIMTLNLPMLSATSPGNPRPMIDAEFKIARM
jgi:hypothetical protein